jgi:alpha-tubulin suppressor-like RCC1 family protein
VAIKTDGTLWAWGRNTQGQLGIGNNDDKYEPTKVGAANDWASVTAGYYHTLAIKTDGSLWAWGLNDNGQLGGGSGNQNEPIRVDDSKWNGVKANWHSSMGIKDDGSLWAWGQNQYGQLGFGDQGGRRTPAKVGEEGDWKDMSVSNLFGGGIRDDGSLWTAGFNNAGVLGHGTFVSWDPVEEDYILVLTLTREVTMAGDWAAMSAGFNHLAAIKADGTLWTCGDGWRGRLGQGEDDTANRHTLTKVGTEDTWAAVACGGYHTVAIRADGSLWACGLNRDGQLGDGTNDQRNSLVKVGDGYRVPTK